MIFLELALFQAPDGTGSVGIPFWTVYASRLIFIAPPLQKFILFSCTTEELFYMMISTE
jgi:hypothetical protein